jgi:nitrite reductase (NADH) small subunit
VAPIEVARLGELEQRRPTPRRVGEREVLLVRDGETVYALRDSCPHMAVSMAEGVVVPFAAGSPDAPRFDDGRLVLVCPWHQYEFSVATGACLTSDRLAVRTYSVTIRGDSVFVDLGAHAVGAS